jgi:hypothetical protein
MFEAITWFKIKAWAALEEVSPLPVTQPWLLIPVPLEKLPLGRIPTLVTENIIGAALSEVTEHTNRVMPPIIRM